jgi:hypothetical protein
MIIPKKRQSSGISHLSEPFVAAEGYAFHDGKSLRLLREWGRNGECEMMNDELKAKGERSATSRKQVCLVYSVYLVCLVKSD